jgi:hypothetical protein
MILMMMMIMIHHDHHPYVKEDDVVKLNGGNISINMYFCGGQKG